MKERIGVYICHCGGNISDYVDVEEIGKMLKEQDGIIVSKDVMFACADSNQKEMVNDIKENKLDAIVVASCSPKLHLHTFKNVAERAGLNPYNYTQVNIREQCSWPHSDKPKEATAKAIGLIRSGIKRVTQSEALENLEISAEKAVIVVGAGVAGMRAAIDLANSGNEVFLIEKDFFVGGRIVQTGKLFMSGQEGKDIIANLYSEIKKRTNITLFTGADIEKVSGSIGNFSVDIKIKPRFINPNQNPDIIKNAVNDCAVSTDDVFNFGVVKRKAIYKNYPEALPDVYVADAEALKNETGFVEKYKELIDLEQKPEILTIKASSVLVNTGFDPYQPKEDEYGYKNIGNVVTLNEFKRIIEFNPEKLTYNNKPVNKIAFIYCVGNRQTKGENKYCSRVCCTSAIYTSLQINEKYKNITAYHLFRDIRTYGKQEILYEKSSKQGDIYIRFEEKEPPVVQEQNGKITVKVKDYLTSKQELEIGVDLVVLVNGMVSRADSREVAEKFKLPVGNDKFYNEIHPKLKPVETVIKGVFIGGTCQGPKNISESVQSSLSAASKINAIIKGGKIVLDPIVARVKNDACTWCGKCAEVCEYDAVSEVDFNGKKIAAINIATCKGCGICAPVCPVNAIDIAQYTDAEIEGMIDGFMEKIELKEKTAGTEKEEDKSAVTMKEFPQIWKNIIASMNGGKKNIPQLAEEMSVSSDIITYHVMTMNKYGIVVTAGLDEKEEYFYYTLKK
jgi:heterodisulfide reductase subunit A